MTYDLTLGNPAYSSWSLRGWLPFDAFDIPVTPHWVEFSKGHASTQLAHLSPAQTVPVLQANGAIITDSMAILEELATRHPDAGLWPSDPTLRATARSLAAEMHSGFTALRNQCPMNMRIAYTDVPVDDALRADLDRLTLIWTAALDRSGGPWLCGSFSGADIAFAPVVLRLIGYDLPLAPVVRDYAKRVLAHPSMHAWRDLGMTVGDDLDRYTQPWPQVDWASRW